MINISAFGVNANLVASTTFPNGFPITAFADDADAVDTPDFELADTGMGINGDLLVWSKPQTIEVTTNIIAGSPEDINLTILFQANRVGKGKSSSRDIIRLNWTYPNGLNVNLSPGIMVTGTALPKLVSTGRFASRLWRFRFENVTNSGNGL